jgi:photosystem II stability/assembly factor-like uncharacterized protein
MKRLLLVVTFFVCCAPLFAQWTTLASGTNEWLRGVCFTHPDTGYVVGYNGTILKTTNGTTWSPQVSGTTEHLMSVFFVTAGTGFASGTGGKILKTTNAGANWTALPSGTTVTLHEIFFVDPNNGYAAGEFGVCLKTINGGATWTPLTMSTGNGRVSLFFIDVNNGYVVGAGFTDAIQKTTNAGASWANVHGSTFDEFSSICFTDINNGCAVSTNSTILKTTNAGSTWTSQPSPVSDGLYAIKFPLSASGNVGYAVGGYPNNSVVLKTADAGMTWTQQNSGTPNSLFDVFFLDLNLGYAVGRYGTIIKTMNGGVGVGEEPGLPEISIYPNPVSSFVTIDNPTPGSQLQMQVVDVSGKLLLTDVIGEGRHTLDLSGLPGGIYFLQFRNDQLSFSRKVVVSH